MTKKYRNKETGEIVEAFLERKARSQRNVYWITDSIGTYELLVKDFNKQFEVV